MARILVAEDDADFREVLALGLALAGHIVLEVADGLGALASLRGQPPDVVLLDLNMPGLTGEDVVAACRRTPRWAAVPIALISGREDVAEVAERLRVAGHLQKPARLAAVRRLVDTLTTPRRTAAGDA